MDWWLGMVPLFGGFVILLLMGMPVAFSFTVINLVAVFLFWGGEAGLQQIVRSIYASVADWSLVPAAMFILMGEAMFQTGVAFKMIEALESWLGRLPGRLSLLSVLAGTVFASTSGSSMAGVALLGSVLVPEMERRGYNKILSIGPILGSGGLAVLIPPSILAVLLASAAQISVAKVLVGGITPGIVLAFFYVAYVVVRCWLQPDLAPPYDVAPMPWSQKIGLLVRYVMPLGLIVFSVLGLMFLGIASPTEASATGAFATFIVAILYRRLTRETIKKTILSTSTITGMIFMIFTGSIAFSQVLAYSGATKGLTEVATAASLPPIVLVLIMQAILILLGCFIDQVSTIMITVPIFWPILNAVGIDPVWFAIIMLVNLELGALTPPFGLALFVMKGVAPEGTTWGDIYRAVWPIIAIQISVIGLMILFPSMVRWLPDLATR